MSDALFVWNIREISVVFGGTIIGGFSTDGCPRVNYENNTISLEILIGSDAYTELYNASLLNERNVIRLSQNNRVFFAAAAGIRLSGTTLFGVEYPVQKFTFDIHEVHRI